MGHHSQCCKDKLGRTNSCCFVFSPNPMHLPKPLCCGQVQFMWVHPIVACLCE